MNTNNIVRNGELIVVVLAALIALAGASAQAAEPAERSAKHLH